MPRDRGGIGRTGKKHKKKAIFDVHRQPKVEVVQESSPAAHEAAATNEKELEAAAAVGVFGEEVKMVFSSEISGFGRRSFWYALPSQLTPATLSAPSPTTAPFQARSLLLSTVARRKSGATATVCGALSTSFCRR